jgi:hypothetical protein
VGTSSGNSGPGITGERLPWGTRRDDGLWPNWDDPRAAYEAVSGVWSPDGPWRRLIDEQLRKHKVAFEIL